MCQMLLSINPEHVLNILSGTKRYEFRKFRCRPDVDKIIIYATAPLKTVVAEADIEEIIEGAPHEVWEKTRKAAGVSQPFFNSYYEGRDKAIAYKLKNVKVYQRSKALVDFGLSYAPQSFAYVS